jgi:uncharacterized protein (TIGR00290 family)
MVSFAKKLDMGKDVFHWSGGKDATLALHTTLAANPDWDGILLTTVNAERARVTMHGVRNEVLAQQAQLLDIPLTYLPLPEDIGMEDYSALLSDKLAQLQAKGFDRHIYGDINLEDLRSFRDSLLQQLDMEALYPLWMKPTKELAKEFIALGYEAIVVAVNGKLLDKSFAGRKFDQDFIDDLPENVDPCGENGEFHTLVINGPIFESALNVTVGEVTYHSYTPKQEDDDCFCEDEKDESWDYGFWFADIILA